MSVGAILPIFRQCEKEGRHCICAHAHTDTSCILIFSDFPLEIGKGSYIANNNVWVALIVGLLQSINKPVLT
jgi:hypothetical protein